MAVRTRQWCAHGYRRGYSTGHTLDKLGSRRTATLLWCHMPAHRDRPINCERRSCAGVRKVGAPLGVIIALGTVAGLIVILLTAVNPVGDVHRVRALQHRDDRGACWRTCGWTGGSPSRRGCWCSRSCGARRSRSSCSRCLRDLHSRRGSIPATDPAEAAGISPFTLAIGAPVIEEAAKGLFLLLMMTGRRRNELNSLTDCLVYAGPVGGGFRLVGGHPLHRQR